MATVYTAEAGTGVYRRPSAPSFAYSDSGTSEEHLLRFISGARDRSVASPELRAGIVDWPSYYHLSARRCDLLRPVDCLLTGDVLEAGAGCGALTRYLGERAASVSAVEGSLQRARIAAVRCAGLNNVQIYCDHLEEFSPGRQFDAVTCIGVIEYSPLYYGGCDPFARMLSGLASHLKPEGYLLIAIENRLGLKYFTGAPEDHTGRPFQGIEDLYDARGPVTLGRREWDRQLAAASLEAVAYLYPFPDYKHPEAVLTDAGFEDPEVDAGELVRQWWATNQDRDYERLFSDEMAWPVLLRNGLAAMMANSFLIVARKTGAHTPPWTPDVLAWQYATDRLPAYATESRIARDPARGLLAHRRRLYPGRPQDASCTIQTGETPLPAGKRFMSGLYRIVNTPSWTYAAIAGWAKLWVEYLFARGASAASGILELSPDLLDCIPRQLTTVDGSIRPLPAEFSSSGPVPLDFVLFRGLFDAVSHLGSCAPSAPGMALGCAELVYGVMDLLGVHPTPQRRLTLLRMEAALESTIRGVDMDACEERLRRARLTVRGPHGAAPQSEFETQVFWRRPGEQFAETSSSRIRSRVEPVRRRVQIRIPPLDPPPAELRFDLADRPGIIQIFDIRLIDGTGRLLWYWDRNPRTFAACNELVIAESDGAVFAIMPANDAFLHLPVASQALEALRAGGTIEFELAWCDPVLKAYELAGRLLSAR